jgi:hypothetical protein
MPSLYDLNPHLKPGAKKPAAKPAAKETKQEPTNKRGRPKKVK